jgi:uncharacterized protein (DUF1330 family)
MTAYVIVDIEVIDPVRYEDYKKMAHATVLQFGGKYIARGGFNETLEGDWHANRLVILEFSSVEQAKKWHDSAEYAPALALRQQTAKTKMVVVEGT